MMLYTASIKEATIIGIEGYSYQWKTYDLQVKGGEKNHVEDDPAMFWCQGLGEEEVPSRFMPMLWTQTAVSKEHLIESALLARRARFEHGETPEVKGVTADA